MKYKIFQITGFVFEMIGLLILTTLSIMFFIASIDNMKLQTRIKKFVNSATFEMQSGNTCYYYVESDELDCETIKLNYYSNGNLANPTLGNVGDMFVMPQSRIDYVPFSMEFITYLFGGHAGINVEHNKLVEAMGGSADAMFINLNPSDLFYEERTVVGLRVKAPIEDRMKAVETAKSLVGKPYNYLFVLNTKDRYYCTDICHRIFSDEFGLDYSIDTNGFHVSCQDIMKSDDVFITYVKIVKDGKTHIYYLKNTNIK